MAGLSIGLGLTVPAPGPVVPLSLAPVACYLPADRAGLFQDVAGTVPVLAAGDPVGLMRDRSGNGHHLTAPSDAARPTYQRADGQHWLAFDGVDDELATAAALPFSAEVFACLAFALTGYNTAFPNILSSRGAGSGDGLSQPLVYAKEGDDALRLRFGSQVTSVNYGAALPGASIVMSGTAAGTARTVDIGVSSAAYTVASALTDGSADPLRVSGYNRFQGRFYGLVQVNRVPTAVQIAATRAYFAARSGGLA